MSAAVGNAVSTIDSMSNLVGIYSTIYLINALLFVVLALVASVKVKNKKQKMHLQPFIAISKAPLLVKVQN